MKLPTGWKSGGKFAAVLVVMGLIFVGLNNGTMKSMNGQQISLFGESPEELNRIEPTAGEVYVSGASPSNGEDNEEAESEPYDFGISGVAGSSSDGEGDGVSHEEGFILAIPPVQQQESCGDHSGWVGKKVDEQAVKATGQPYRILKPDSMVTEDFNAQRINVITNDENIVIEVRCG